jgi:hypothetical protein
MCCYCFTFCLYMGNKKQVAGNKLQILTVNLSNTTLNTGK